MSNRWKNAGWAIFSGLLISVLSASLLSSQPVFAATGTASTTTSEIDQQNNGGNKDLIGGTRIDIAVDPKDSRDIKDVHLCVAFTTNGGGKRQIAAGDPNNRNYTDMTAALPAGWSYNGMSKNGFSSYPPNNMWCVSWSSTAALTAATTFSVAYSGDKSVTPVGQTLFLTKNGASTFTGQDVVFVGAGSIPK